MTNYQNGASPPESAGVATGPPASAEAYVQAETEYSAGGRTLDDIIEVRKRYFCDSPNLDALEAQWRAQDAVQRLGTATSTPLPIALYATAIESNMTARGNLARLIRRHGPRLLIALPDPGEPADTPSDIYGLEPTGVLTRVAARSYYEDTQTQYIADATPPPDDDGNRRRPTGSAVYRHALECNESQQWREMLKEAASALHYWIQQGIDLNQLVIRRKSDADLDLEAIGTPGGVLDLLTGQIVSAEEGRQRFITASVPDPYDPTARHPACEAILPPLEALVPGSVEDYRARALALMMTRPPRRELVVEICAAGSGKSSFANALRASFSPAYIGTIPIERLLEPRFKSRVANEHNGELRTFIRPTRIVFSTESGSGGKLDDDLSKRISGGDPITFRAIREAPETHMASAHLWLQGNTNDEGQLELGLAGDDENAQALRDRARLLPRDRIPDEVQVPEWCELGYDVTDDARLYRQAVVARVVEYCKAFAGQDWPQDLPEMKELLEEQRDAEKALWQSEWLPNCLVKQEGAFVTTEAVYGSYLSWMARNEPTNRDLKGQKSITAKVARHYSTRATRERTGAVEGGGLVRAFKGLSLAPVSLFQGDFLRE